METETLLAETLKEYPGNPRKGDIDKIAESLKANGQYKPIVVQKSTNFVLVGNHTLKAIKKLGWDFVDAVILDVDDVEAKRIVLADNRTSDGSTYDYMLLNEMLLTLPNLEGTGYDKAALDQLINTVNPYISELEHSDTGSRGLGTPIVHYDIVFDSEEQQAVFYGLIRYLKAKYPEAQSVGERLTRFINELEL
jgi:ParB-like chromosome segregation protein Spo0J